MPDQPDQPASATPRSSARRPDPRGGPAKPQVGPAKPRKVSATSISEAETFDGFTRPTANFVRCPNQYLDLCVPRCSIHVARLVGYLIRETIGWVKHNGEPRRQKVSVTYTELVTQARVSRSKLRPAIDEAIALGFVVCEQPPRQQSKGVPARSGVYALRWDESGQLTRSLEAFVGFKFGGDCRTPIPNQFFDRVLTREKHSVTRVVSAVLRHTVGYTNGITGERLEQAPLSYNRLLAFSPMDRKTLAAALREAEAAGYIRRVLAGRFSPTKSRQRAAVYAVRWQDDETPIRVSGVAAPGHGSPIPPEKSPAARQSERFTDSTRIGGDGSRIPPERRLPDSTSGGAPMPPETRFPKSTTRKTTTQKQQQTAEETRGEATAGDAAVAATVERLKAAGFAGRAAAALAREHDAEIIRRQIEWLPMRKATRNRLGLLRRAIEEDWARPQANTPLAARSPSLGVDEQARREAYEQRHRPAYLAFLATLEPQLAASHGARYAAFVAERATKREALASSSEHSPRMLKVVLRQFDSQEARLEDLAEAFDGEVPGFWSWDEEHRARGSG